MQRREAVYVSEHIKRAAFSCHAPHRHDLSGVLGRQEHAFLQVIDEMVVNGETDYFCLYEAATKEAGEILCRILG